MNKKTKNIMDWENDVPLSPEEPVSSPHSYKSAMNESSKRFVANKTAKTGIFYINFF